jgi:Leucine-rich repeat (LRR) protein
VDPFAELRDLCALTLLNAPVRNLDGVRPLRKLRFLRLGNLTRLASLAGIEALTELEELEVHTSPRISSIDPIGSLENVRMLYLNNDGRIESLKPLTKLHRLESVIFYESTDIVDGDLSPLMHQSHLSRVSFKDRPHYSHRRRDVTPRT